MQKRRSFSAACKAKIATGALKEQQTLQQLAQRYELHPYQISALEQELVQNSSRAFINSLPCCLASSAGGSPILLQHGAGRAAPINLHEHTSYKTRSRQEAHLGRLLQLTKFTNPSIYFKI